MRLRIVDLLADGIKRTVARNGLLLVAATYALTAPKALFAPRPTETRAALDGPLLTDPVVGDSILLGAAITFGLLAGSVYVVVVAFRTFATDETASIPADAFPDRPSWAVANVMVGFTISMGLAVIGSVSLLVPGAMLLVGLWFFDLFVAIDGDDFVTGFRRSWALTRGVRPTLFGLGCLVVATWAVLTFPFLLVGAVLGGIAGQFLVQIPVAFCLVATYATTTTAFTALRDGVDAHDRPDAVSAPVSPQRTQSE